MISRVYFLKASQDNKVGGRCHSFRTMVYKTWLPVDMSKVVSDFFNEISEANSLPFDEWVLESFSRVK